MSSSTLKPAQRPSVWLARKAQQGGLIAALEKHGFSVLEFSPLVTVPAAASDVVAQLAEQPTINGAIFVSPSAVEIFHQQVPQGLFAGRCYGPGAATAAALEAHSYPKVEAPTAHYNSEALLALNSLQEVAGQHFVIVGGDSGRPLIEATLKARGATVATLVCYRREAVVDWREPLTRPFGYALFSSGQAYQAAAAVVGDQLARATVVVTSARLASEIRSADYNGKLLVCEDASPDALADFISTAESEANCGQTNPLSS